MACLQIELQLRSSTFVLDVDTDDGAALLDIRSGICFFMSPRTAKSWRMLKQNYPLNRIVDSLASEFSYLPKQQIAEDMYSLVNILVKLKLLVGGEPRARETRQWRKSDLSVA